MSAAFAARFDRLLSLPPGSPEATLEQHAIESDLMVALAEGGRQAGEALVDSLASHGHALERLDALPCMWLVPLPAPRVLELWFTGVPVDTPILAALSYREGTPWGTPRQRRAARLQKEFYERYAAVGLAAHTTGAALLPEDRLVLLVGDLEADVNNGGFGQYLQNKGGETAREALACLQAVKAKRVAAWLTEALDLGPDAPEFARLDRAFGKGAEDLAALVMRHFEKQSREPAR